jgi:hypothetical protein
MSDDPLSWHFLHHKMSEWVPLTVMEVRLLWLVDEGLLRSKEVAGWRAIAGEAILDPWPRETVSFTDFHGCRFGILASDFLLGFPATAQRLAIAQPS